MSESNETMRRKIKGANSIKSVVRTMKAVAGSNIYEYENAVNALDEYFYTTKMSLVAYFRANKLGPTTLSFSVDHGSTKTIGAIIFGAEQGLVGQFNDIIAEYVIKELEPFKEDLKIWTVGEGVYESVNEVGGKVSGRYDIPNSVSAITPLVENILMDSEERLKQNEISELHIFYNSNTQDLIYEPVHKRLLPLDEVWMKEFTDSPWPTAYLPEVIGDATITLFSFIHEYLFAEVFRACARSLAAENSSRLATAQRADENIGELLETLNRKYQELRQNTIDEEMFDIISSFETMSKKK